MRTTENIAAVAESMREAPTTSIYRRSQQLNISETSYKVQLVQDLKLIDHPMRFRFAKWACDRLIEVTDFGKKKKSFFQMKLILTFAGM